MEAFVGGERLSQGDNHSPYSEVGGCSGLELSRSLDDNFFIESMENVSNSIHIAPIQSALYDYLGRFVLVGDIDNLVCHVDEYRTPVGHGMSPVGASDPVDY